LRRAIIVAALAGTTALLAACGGGSKTSTGPAGPGGTVRAASSAPRSADTAPRAPTTTTKPRDKVRNTPQCKAYSQFSMANFALSFAAPANRDAVIKTYQVRVNALKEQLPQFSADIDRIYVLSVKSVQGGLSDQEQAEYRQVFQGIKSWYEQNCLIKPGTPEYEG
jgi:hypothetical protein